MLRSALFLLILTFSNNVSAEIISEKEKQNILQDLDTQIKAAEKKLKGLVSKYNKTLKGERVESVKKEEKTLEERIENLEKKFLILEGKSENIEKDESQIGKKSSLPNPEGFKIYSNALAIWHRAERENNKAVSLQAADEFEKFINQYPSDFYHVHALVYQGKCVYFAGETDRAEKLYLKALDQYLKKKNPDHKVILAIIHLDLAKIHYKKGKKSEAKQRAQFILKHYDKILSSNQKKEVEAIVKNVLQVN